MIKGQFLSVVAGIALPSEAFLFEERQDQRCPAFGKDPPLSIPDLAGVVEQCPAIVGMGKGAIRAVVAVQGEADLLQVAQALGAVGGLAGFLDGCQKQTDQEEQDRKDDQQFHEGKGLGWLRAPRITEYGPLSSWSQSLP